MAVSKAESIFLGHTPVDQRRYLTAVLKHLLPTHPRIHLPAVGQFTLARCAIEAGYERKNVFTSDISLFSGLLGSMFAGHDLDLMDYKLSVDNELRLESLLEDHTDTPEYRAAYTLWVMKVCQIRKIHYMKAQLNDLLLNYESHISHIHEQVIKMRAYFDGINYEHKDLREVLTAEYQADDLVVVNPPVFAKGYTKMFDFEGEIEFDPAVEEFNFGKEYRATYDASKESVAPMIWYRSSSVAGFDPAEVIYAKEYKVNKVDYWLMTKPELLADFQHTSLVKTFGRKRFVPYKAPMVDPDYEITEKTKISFVSVKEEAALYYRDLWAHKLGNTKGEHYFLMLLDGKVFATLGIMTNKVYRLQSDYVFENYGFNAPLNRYPKINRLLMWAITAQPFGDIVRAEGSSVNRYYKLKGLRTTCLAKYRSVKLNNGILKVETRERMPNGMYKILYWTDFRDETFADVIKRYIAEESEAK